MPTPSQIPRQSGVLPFRRTSDGLEVLLITSNTRKRWIIPKGNIEQELGEVESARREAFEEAGVEGTIRRRPLGSYTHQASGGPTLVRVFVMEVETVLDAWPEASSRRRAWMPPSEASDRILERGLQNLIQTFGDAECR